MGKMETIYNLPDNSLAYRDAGRGTPILLVHGWGVSGALFDAQISGLSEHYRVLVPDLPGHGASGAFPDGAKFSSLADRIAGLISTLQLKDTILVGWSMGAMVAWDLLLRLTQADIAGLVTIDMVPHLLSEPGWPHGLRNGSGIQVFDPHVDAMHRNWPEFAAQFVQAMFATSAGQQLRQLIDQSEKVALANDPESLASLWMRMAEQDFREDIARLKLPTRVVAGCQSRLYRMTASEWVAAQIPEAQLVRFTRSGHAPHMEEPEQFNRMLAEFVHSINSQQPIKKQLSEQAGTGPQ